MTKPIIPWIGGKRKLASHLLPLFPNHHTYVEPFCGAAALFFIKEPSPVEVLNDINGELTNLYRVVKHHLEELYKQFKWILVSREHWTKTQQTPANVLTDVQRAARFLYLQKLAYGGKVQGQTFGYAATSRPAFNLLTLEQDLTEAHFRLSSPAVYVENLDWWTVIEKYDTPDTLFYCDPPYWKTEGYGVEFGFEHYERMLELAKTIKGRMIISINGHPDIVELFQSLPSVEVDYKYTLAKKSQSDCKEMIYGNWQKVPEPKGMSGSLFD